MADTQQPALQDRYRASQAGEFGEASQVTDRFGDGSGGLIGYAQHHDACVTARRIGTDITQPDIQGDQDPASSGGRRDDMRVRSAGETFGGNGVDIMARAGKDGAGRGGQVLVELELHRDGGIGTSSSRANAAPYAAAARIRPRLSRCQRKI